MKGLVIATILSVGAVVGCSQKDELTATAIPTPVTSTATHTPAAIDPDPPATIDRDLRRDSSVGRGFVPLDNPSFLAAHEAEYLSDEDLVLGVEWAGEVRAYPVRMLRFHHIVNDTVEGKPLLVTY